MPKELRKENDRSFFNDSSGFSFKDVLALLICVPYVVAIVLYLIYYLKGWDNLVEVLTLIETLHYTVGIILGGYFLQETTEVVSNYMSKRRAVTVQEAGVCQPSEADPYPLA